MHNHKDENGNLAPIVHNDIKLQNMMREKQENSQLRLREGQAQNKGSGRRSF
jgi:hypothetical protein